MNVLREIFGNPVLNKLYFKYLRRQDLEKAEILLKQTKKGLEKYGHTVDYKEKTAEEWKEFRLEQEVDRDVYALCEKYALEED